MADVTLPPGFAAETTYVVDESDFSEFVSNYYGRPYKLQQREMLGQNTYQEHKIDADEWEYGEEAIRLWLDLPLPDFEADWLARVEFVREHGPSAEELLWDLCRKGVVPAGNYLIKVWW